MATNVQQATLTVWKFRTSDGAAQAVQTLKSLQQQGLINFLDGAIVSWPANKKKPKTEQLKDFKGAGALTGSFWGLLFGLIFFVPILGWRSGAGLERLGPWMATVGFPADSFRGFRSEVSPGPWARLAFT